MSTGRRSVPAGAESDRLPGSTRRIFPPASPARSRRAIGDAFEIIKRGAADAMIAGGSEAAVCAMGIGGFAALRALSTRNNEPERASRPFDRDRDGFVLGEGAGVIVLEELGTARSRGAKRYAALVG